MGDRHEPGRSADQALQVVQEQLAAVVHGDDAQLRARSSQSICQGTMLEWCSIAGDQDLVALAATRAAVGLGHQVDGLGGAAGEDDLGGVGALMKRRALRAGLLEGAVARSERWWTPRCTLALSLS